MYMENNTQNTCAECANHNHGMCGYGWHHMHGSKSLIVWLIKIAVLVLVFSFAFKMGELKGMLEAGGGYHHHGWGGNGGDMMYDQSYWDGAPDSTAPAAPSPSGTKVQ